MCVIIENRRVAIIYRAEIPKRKICSELVLDKCDAWGYNAWALGGNLLVRRYLPNHNGLTIDLHAILRGSR